MRKSTLVLAGFLIITSAFWSCKSGDDVKEAENEVFALHDEVMPKMDDIMRLRKLLTQYVAAADSAKDSGSAAGTLRTSEEREQAGRLLLNLNVADSLMMGWMDHYNGDTLAKLSSDDALRYLTDQKEQITDVNTKVKTSIDQAMQFLQKK
ncbi:viral A-type inclusion protein [Spirosoma sp. BT702]|uniref:Viral A-type inclusion protein n=1 Tax=Spirosoma profusum TaxID=2771354 RepID=A0A927ATD8_9BACT|nr:viral A-type inclusion protein [Spirosoma profusum]MBD2703260.1 viral A-type inclusion protein [Spirosoma profusum]